MWSQETRRYQDECVYKNSLLHGPGPLKFKILNQQPNFKTGFFSPSTNAWATEGVLLFQFLQLFKEENSISLLPKGYLLELFISSNCWYYGFLYCVSIHLKTIACKFQDTHKKSMHPSFIYWKFLKRSLEDIVPYSEYNSLRSGIHPVVFLL